jgi:type I restriction enzyme M protein
MTQTELSSFIWSVADLIRGPYRPPQYERVMLPLTVLRRFDCVLEATKPAVLKRYKQLEGGKVKNVDPILNKVAGGGTDIGFHNHSALDFEKLKGDPDHIALNLMQYIKGFSANVRDIFLEYFEFQTEIEKLEEANRLYLVVSKFADIDLHPDSVDNIQMGLIFEDLIRRFNEAANETAGDHFTPREVVRLMVNLLLEPDGDVFKPGIIKTMLDPTCGTGGMLAVSQNWIHEHNEGVRLIVHGQDYNKRAFAIAASDMLIKGHQNSEIVFGNTLTEDRFSGRRFDYFLANPPFGVNWETDRKFVTDEHKKKGFDGRFGPGLPRVSDGALLFLLHMVSKFQEYVPGSQEKLGSRLGIVFNGSPLFTGGAGSGESEIRRWVIENDWLEAIVALPESMFYNTGIGTYVWIVTNRKEKHRKGRIQLIDARERWTPMRRSLGEKRRYISDEQIDLISREHGAFRPAETCKLFDNEDFGYRRITVERPLRLRFQVTDDAKEKFLDQCPALLPLIQAAERELGTDRYDDWNEVADRVREIAKQEEVAWTAREKEFFREVFTARDPECEPVIEKRSAALPDDVQDLLAARAKASGLSKAELVAIYGFQGGPRPPGAGSPRAERTGHQDIIRYEADSQLRDVENVPLKEPIERFFLREVRPYVAEAWIDHEAVDEKDNGVGKVGYEINFNRHFYKYEPPRPLEEIDRELGAVEKRIVEMLSRVTQNA